MASIGSAARPMLIRWIAVAVVVVALLGAAMVMWRPAAPGPIAANGPGPPSGPATPSQAPTFDIVRVSPQGSAVVAGRAEPGADVILLDGTTELARGRADRRGEFVILPSEALPPGGRQLTLASRAGSGAPDVKSDGSVLVLVPSTVSPGNPAAPAPVAVLLPSTDAPKLLQSRRTLSVDVVDYDTAGAIRFTGAAEPGSTLRGYVDNGVVGDAKTDAAGHWAMSPASAVVAGDHRLRVDQLGTDGRVLARVELPFQRSVIAPADLANGKVVVQPGQTLWRLARAAYGSGVRYTVIYMANKDQIRDPRLIYPGQAFAVPTPH